MNNAEREYRKIVCDIVSRMLDNPDKWGIYPTSKCYIELIEALKKAEKKGLLRGAEIAESVSHIPFSLNVIEIIAGSIRREANE